MKKKIYTVVTIILCLLLIFYAYERTLIKYIIGSVRAGENPEYVYLFNIAWLVLSIAGGIGGYFLSKVWWRIVYVDKRHWSDLVKKWKK